MFSQRAPPRHDAKDYQTCIAQAKKDKLANARPEPVSLPENMEQYDEIYLGYPNYWGTMPMAVYTFLDSFDWMGKTIHPFCTHEGSGLSNTERDIAEITIGDGCSFNPRLTICTARKPVSPDHRKYLYADPVHIWNNCRIGAGTVICPGVTIGDNCYIHSGSVVKEDLPANSVCSGNPCKVIRTIGEQDRSFYGGDRAITDEDLEEIAEIVSSDKKKIGNTTQWKFGALPESHQEAAKKHRIVDGVDVVGAAVSSEPRASAA